MNFDQNRNEFRLKPKTAGKIREDVHEVEVVEAHISEEKPEQHQTALNATDAKTRFYFCRKPKNRKRNRTGTTNRNSHQETNKPKSFSTKIEKPI